MVLGILRPLIVIPTDLLERLRPDELVMILMHELAHVRRYDNLTLLIQRLVTVALFFHPAVWLCGRMLQREAEQACDDLVILSTGRSQHYARGLTSVAELADLRTHLRERIPIMNVSEAAESDLARRIRRALAGRARRMSTRSRVLAALLLCGVCAVAHPSIGLAGGDDEIDWNVVKTTAPEQWSEELRAQIVAAGHDLDAIAERVRQSQRARRDKPMDLEAIGLRIRAAVEAGELTPEEGRERMAATRQRLAAGGGDARLRKFQRGVVARAMAMDPEDWSDELKAAILRAGWDLEAVAERVRQAQNGDGELGDLSNLDVANTAIQARSWGQVKAGAANPE